MTALIKFTDMEFKPCRVFCIGRNYRKHIREMGGDPDCVIFMKPISSLVFPGEKVILPRNNGSIHHELEFVIVIGKPGKNIPSENALQHVKAVTLGIDLTLRDVQKRLKNAGQPWEISKAFDQSAPIGDLLPYQHGMDLSDVDMTCTVNGDLRQSGNTRDMIFSVPELIHIVSQTWALFPGDLIYTGTPHGVGPVQPRDTITIASPQIGTFFWKFN